MPQKSMALPFRIFLFVGGILLMFPGIAQSGIGALLAIIALAGDRFILRPKKLSA
jgi:UPF0716 family protein affecting phage T7 exclusion